MALAKSRSRIYVRGLGTLMIREVEPTPAAAFSDVGYLSESSIIDEATMEEIYAETGDLVDWLESQRKTVLTSQLLQSGVDEFNITRAASGKVYTIRYMGQANRSNSAFQYFLIPNGKITPGLNVSMKNGMRTVPVAIRALKDFSLAYDPFDYALVQSDGALTLDGLLWFIAPQAKLNAETIYVLDIGGFGYNGTLPSARATTIWFANTLPTVPEYFLRFDGTNDYASFGDVLDDDGTSDFAVEAWLRVQVANGSALPFIAKKAAYTGNSAGWSLARNTSNFPILTLGTGAANAIAIGGATMLQNVWVHVFAACDRNGNATVYVNGTAGSPVIFSGLTTGTNADQLYIGQDTAATRGQFDSGAIRYYRWAAGALPSNIATIAAAHYNAEKAQYGL